MLSDNHEEECKSFGNDLGDLFVCVWIMPDNGIEECYVKPVVDFCAE